MRFREQNNEGNLQGKLGSPEKYFWKKKKLLTQH